MKLNRRIREARRGSALAREVTIIAFMVASPCRRMPDVSVQQWVEALKCWLRMRPLMRTQIASISMSPADVDCARVYGKHGTYVDVIRPRLDLERKGVAIAEEIGKQIAALRLPFRGERVPTIQIGARAIEAIAEAAKWDCSTMDPEGYRRAYLREPFVRGLRAFVSKDVSPWGWRICPA